MTNPLQHLVTETIVSPAGEHISVLDSDKTLAFIYGSIEPYSDAGTSLFRFFIDNYSIYYYTSFKPNFSLMVGARRAIAKGCKFLLADSLS